MEVVLEIAGDQIDGAREYQEDAFLTTYLEGDGGPKASALIVLADGMGGHAAGNIASNLVVSTFHKIFQSESGKADIPDIMHEGLASGNKALAETINETPALSGMGSTIAAAAIIKGKLWWLSVGDSHIYVIRDRELVKHNEDHSYGGYLDRMQAQGIEVEMEPGLKRHMLMSAITGEEIFQIDCPVKPLQLLPGDRVIIASDGLDILSSSTVIQNSVWSSSARDCAAGLLRAVEDAKHPRQDNTTLVVVDVLDEDAERASGAQTVAREVPLVGEKNGSSLSLDRAVPRAAARVKTPSADRPRRGLYGAIAALLLGAVAFGLYYFDGVDALAGALPAHKVTKPARSAKAPTAATAEPPEWAVDEPSRAPSPGEQRPAPRPTLALEEFTDRLRSGGAGPLMVELPGGAYEVGSGNLALEADERPRHRVELRPFAISKYEVSLGEYQRFAKATGRRAKTRRDQRASEPAAFVNFADALAFVKWLSNESGRRYRLPSEAEWEYAASAGTQSTFWWGREVGEKHAHCFDCSSGFDTRSLAPVGSFEPNLFGLHDTAGNVLEWTLDCYQPSYAGASSDGSARNRQGCETRVARGGSYASTSKSVRSKKRFAREPGRRYDDLGLRVVRDLETGK